MSYYNNNNYHNNHQTMNNPGYGREVDATRPSYNSYRGQSYYNSRQFSGRRGQPRGRGGQKRQVAPTTQTPIRPEPATPAVPQPSHLSKTNSKKKNDPLYHEAWFPDAGDEFVPEPDVLYIQSGCDDLPVITEVTYKTTVSTKVGFARRVPESAWA